jgi:uncharacterized membrane protein
VNSTLLLTIFYVVWLCAVLVLLYGIWRSSTNHVHRMEQTLVDVAMKSAEAAKAAGDAVSRLAPPQQGNDEHVH